MIPSRDELVFLTPYFLSILVLAGIMFYASRNRYIRGARIFAWHLGGHILTLGGSVLELVSADLQTKLFWNTFQWLTAAFLVTLPFLLFALRFSGQTHRSTSFTLGVVLTCLGLFTTLLLTDYLHHLVYRNVQMIPSGPFRALTYDVTPVLFFYLLLFTYGANLYGIVLIIRQALQPYNLFRVQDLIVASGFFLPLAFSLFPLLNIPSAPQRDLAPFVIAVGNLLVTWGLFHNGLFEIAPLARQHIMENLSDPIIVLDPRRRIVDINQAGLLFLEKQKSAVIGQAYNLVFAQWPPLVEVINHPFLQKKEIAMTDGQTASFLNVDLSPLLGSKREVLGRIIIIRDSTERKALEEKYQANIKQLEEQLKNYSQELHQATERYQAIVENHSDLIVRWKPDGTRTYVNDVYCRYWGITQEQALARNFLFHTPEEDRSEVEKHIVRLNSGMTDMETEVHRVIKPDGSLVWQEWTDKAIRDEWGKLVEIQSIGREISQHSSAQQNLNA